MPANLIECSFFIPLRRDKELSDGELHERPVWEWLRSELFIRFGGMTLSQAYYEGFYVDPDTHRQVSDVSRRYIVAVDETKIDELRRLLRGACTLFEQKCIYLSVAGRVEFIEDYP